MGKLLHQEQNYTGGSNIIPITQAQYDALPSAQKNDANKWYYITDNTTTGAPIDDNVVATNKVWSSYKVNSIAGGATIDDTTTASDKVWSSNKVYSELDDRLAATISSPADGQIIRYNDSNSKWENYGFRVFTSLSEL